MQFMQKSRLAITVIFFYLLFIHPGFLQAKQESYNKPGGNRPLIEKVIIDYGAMEILIFGQHLRGDVDPELSLSSFPIALSDNDQGAVEMVIAILPEWCEDGDHLLVLKTELGTSSYELHISTPNAQCSNEHPADFVSSCG